jgi:small conductance mechanosensitive channel
MGGSRSLLEELSLVGARALSLGEEAALVIARVAAIFGVILIGWIGYRLVAALIARLLRRLEGVAVSPARAQRARTLGPLLTSIARYLVGFLVAVVILQQIGIDVRTLIVSAGVAGLVIGLGAQSLIKDVVSGFFLLFENLVTVGDVVEVGSHTGVVESVGLRVTKIRKFSGELRIVPNGELTSFGQHSAGWGRAVVEVGVDYAQDAGRVLRVLESVGKAFREAHPGLVLEPPTAEGILRFGDADVMFRLHARVDAQQKFPLELELRRRVKEALDAEGVGGPRAHRVVLLSTDARPGSGRAENKELNA